MATLETAPTATPKGLPLPKSDGGKVSKALDEGFTEQDRVRDVVLSTQMRELERRYARVEERLLKELGSLRSEMGNRMDTLERHVQSEVEAVTTRAAQESQDRQTADKQLGDETHAIKAALTKDLDAMRQSVAKCEREFRQALLDASKALSSCGRFRSGYKKGSPGFFSHTSDRPYDARHRRNGTRVSHLQSLNAFDARSHRR